jgi:hypothetical protein
MAFDDKLSVSFKDHGRSDTGFTLKRFEHIKALKLAEELSLQRGYQS